VSITRRQFRENTGFGLGAANGLIPTITKWLNDTLDIKK
jgi:hypothetical protein